MYARTLPGPEKLCDFFYEDDIQLQIQVPPPISEMIQAVELPCLQTDS